MSVATSPAKTRDSAHYLHAFTNAKANEEQGPLVITRGDGVWVTSEHFEADCIFSNLLGRASQHSRFQRSL